MKKTKIFLIAKILVLLLLSEFSVLLVALVSVCLLQFLAGSSTFYLFGATFYSIVLLLTGINITFAVSMPYQWKGFFEHISQSFHCIFKFLRIPFSLFVPGVTISHEELDEANGVKKKLK